MSAPQQILIKDGKLIDGNGLSPRERVTILIEGNRIKAIRSEGKLEYAEGTKILDARGKTILPGFIDSHVHYRDWMPELFLSYGTTTVQDLGNNTEWILAQKEGVAKGKISGPRIFASGSPLTPMPSRPHHIPVVDTKTAKEAVRMQVEKGVDIIKLLNYPHRYEPAITEKVIQIIKDVATEAHKFNKYVAGHILISAKDAILSGIDSLEHSTGITRSTLRRPEDLLPLKQLEDSKNVVGYPAYLMDPEKFDELIDLMIKKNVFLGPNLTLIGQAVCTKSEEYLITDFKLLNNPNLDYIPEYRRKWLLKGYYERFTSPDKDEMDKLREGYEKHKEFIKQFSLAGGKIMAETDTSVIMPGIGLHRELELLVEAGLSPMEAITAATKTNATFLQINDEIGTIEEGKIADILIINGDPLSDISKTQHIETVIKDGEILDRSYHPHFTNPIPRPSAFESHGTPKPTIEKLYPIIAREDDAPIQLKLAGTGFFNGSIVKFNNTKIPTVCISRTELEATVPSELLKSVGTYPVTIYNRPPNIGDQSKDLSNSDPAFFIIKYK